MTITSKEAAEVARKHDLTLTDASALARLADTVEEADDIAELFTKREPDMSGRIRARVAAARRRREARVGGY